ncbi:MAG: hypothetical protein K2P81_13795 [Bacteriovoracaceae bacterium]|nr:hypothetical protein [Bacteriovoracaceae bacterium]
MKITLLLLSSLFAIQAFANVAEEEIYNNYKQSLFKTENKISVPVAFNGQDQKLFVDALEDVKFEDPTSMIKVSNFLAVNFDLVERLRLEILKLKFHEVKIMDQTLVEDLLNELRKPEVEKRIIYIIAAHETIFLNANQKDIVELAKLNSSYSDIQQDGESDRELQTEIISDLYFNNPDITTYMEGEYIKSVKIFMFCRISRLYPCLMVMKDINGKEIRNADSTLWSHPVLASAKTGLPSYQRNGNTPAGIFTIDSVMPTADQQISYGKFRRMMLNFVPKSKDEVLLKSLMPKSSWSSDWWSASPVARDIGRNLFRIHGTGKINTDPNAPYYPFVRTSGCIANRENIYDGVTYKSQRDLLDAIMKAMEMEPKFENEPKIKGILYIVEIEDNNTPVTIEDLKEFGIK